MPLDLTITPIYRLNGQEAASLPGLLALLPPPNAARGRERDHLIVYLLLAGTATFSTGEYTQVAQDAADMFYQTSGALTTALRAAAEMVNSTLLQRNLTTNGQGQYAVGWLTLAVLRDSQCTLALSGPMHVFYFGQSELRHIHEPATSGKGLGANQSANVYYAQVMLNPNDRLLFLGRAPNEWSAPLQDATPTSLSAMRRHLVTCTQADLNAALMQAMNGKGILNLLSGTDEIKESKKEEAQTAVASVENPPAHVVQPVGFTPPPAESKPAENLPQEKTALANLPRVSTSRDFPASIPRISKPVTDDAEPPAQEPQPEVQAEVKEEAQPPAEQPPKPKRTRRRREPSERTRQFARLTATAIQKTRGASSSISASIGERLRAFIPRLLPNADSTEPLKVSTTMFFFIAVLIPVIVVVIISGVYLRYGQSQLYQVYLLQAQEMRAQALSVTNDPIAQRKSWENVLLNIDKAESYGKTADTISMRQEAEAYLDGLLGITRLQFNPAFSSNLGIDISRMAAGDQDLYMLNAANGEVLRAQATNNGRGFLLDTTFNCGPGQYGEYTVGPLVDILVLPGLNVVNASLLGIDAQGNLLYCAPGQVAKAVPLPPPDTNWQRVTAFTMDGGNLYVLDAPARAVWVYTGQNSSFIARPYFFFNSQTPEKQDVIDLVVSGDDLFMLHADGHVSTCSYSRIASQTANYIDPAPLSNPFPAAQDMDLFTQTNFTQILFAVPPDSSILLLDADTQGILRFSPRELQLQNQYRPTTGTGNPVPPEPVGAIAIAPNHVLYMAVGGQVYFAMNMP